MDTTAMRRLPEKRIWATIDSMCKDLDKAYNESRELLPGDIPEDYEKYMLALLKVRTLADEILRWLLL